MPANTVRVLRPGKWGNPHIVGGDETYYGGPGFECATAEQCIGLYREHIHACAAAEDVTVTEYVAPLRGKHLACWCPLPKEGESDLCHAAALLKLANA